LKILAVGDITSPGGVEYLEKKLWSVRREHGIDFCVVNGENASFITGISKDGAETLLRSGADVITGGNHTMQNFGAQRMLDENNLVLRPINYGKSAPGSGYTVVDACGVRVLVINAMGVVHIDPQLDAPYSFIDDVLYRERGNYDVAILDIHAEATGEKLAIAHNYDGKINVIFGTHTHVPTADMTILPRGSAYVTDLGMCGESGGILGMDIGSVLFKMKTKMPGKFKCAEGEPVADAVIFTLDNSTLRPTAVERIKF
jgi:metallophosphoesterase (TIGR00282 family)